MKRGTMADLVREIYDIEREQKNGPYAVNVSDRKLIYGYMPKLVERKIKDEDTK